MLGIRYINDTAIDIWVGDSSNFITDITTSSDPSSISISIKKAYDQKLRHLGIVETSTDKDPSFKEKVLEIFNTIKQALADESVDYPKRITLILNKKEDYYIVQEIMFKTILKR